MTVQLTIEQINKLISHLDMLTQQVSELRSEREQQHVGGVQVPITNEFRASVKEPRVNLLDVFYGDKDKSKTFLARLKLSFNLQSSRFPDNKSKVLFTISFLKGTAFKWALPYLESENEMLNSYEQFVTTSCVTF